MATKRLPLNSVEVSAQEAIDLALSYLTQKSVNYESYLGLMATLRDAAKKLELKEWYGCATGSHMTPCACQENKKTKCVYTLKYKSGGI